MTMTPNTRKPTKDEVDDYSQAWYWQRSQWELFCGRDIRLLWEDGDRWLPYSAIPDPNAEQQQGEPK